MKHHLQDIPNYRRNQSSYICKFLFRFSLWFNISLRSTSSRSDICKTLNCELKPTSHIKSVASRYVSTRTRTRISLLIMEENFENSRSYDSTCLKNILMFHTIATLAASIQVGAHIQKRFHSTKWNPIGSTIFKFIPCHDLALPRTWSMVSRISSFTVISLTEQNGFLALTWWCNVISWTPLQW